MKRLFAVFFAVLLAAMFCRAAQADAQLLDAQPHIPATEARLVLSATSAKPGETVWVGIELNMSNQWHTYWRFPGTGIPTTAKWTLPPGVSAGDIQWPIPEKSVTKSVGISFYIYGYEKRAVLLVPLKLDASLKPGPVDITASLKWLECEAKGECVEGGTNVTRTLTIGDADKPSVNADFIEQWRARLPLTNANPQATAAWENLAAGDTRAVIIDWQTTNTPADFFPYEKQGADVDGATETLPSPPGHVLLRKAVTKDGANDWPQRLTGILVGRVGTTNEMAVVVDLPLSKTVAAVLTMPAGGSSSSSNAPVGGSASLVAMLLAAFLGGLILNVMPCVLPVIALKVLGFVNQSREAPERVRRLGLVYGIGVLVSFAALAGVAIATQRAGGVANWGDAFRHPQVKIVLTALVTLIALNLFGVFEVTLGSKAMGSAAGLASKEGYAGAFFNGALATFLATPCTAPFLGTALAFAFAEPAAVTLLIFLAAGMGLALPFVAVCFQPRLLKALPKPGAWMEKFKMALGFPMLATAVWLMWLTARTDTDVLWLGIFLVVLALAAWIWGEFVQRGVRRKGLAIVICVLLMAIDCGAILPSSQKKSDMVWKPWSADAVEQERREGHPVLVDFTAKDCLTCQLNKASSLDIAGTLAKFKSTGTVVMVADFTDRDPAIARELRRHNSPGVPLVLVYPKDLSREPQVLPTWLTPEIVQNALDAAAK